MNKILTTFIAALCLALTLVILPYVITFGGKLSHESHEWANFGAYAGGLLSPFISGLALLGLLLTLRQQNKELLSLKKQFSISQVESTIIRIETDFINTLKEAQLKIVPGELTHSHTCYDALVTIFFPNWEKVIPHKDDLDKSKQYNKYSDEIRLYGVFGAAAGHLNQLRLYVNEHRDISSANILSKYYERKYRCAYLRLQAQGYGEKDGEWICGT